MEKQKAAQKGQTEERKALRCNLPLASVSYGKLNAYWCLRSKNPGAAEG